jgi:hypothetical protein
MNEHNFTLILSGDVDAHLDELFEAGCDDATFGEVEGVAYAEFEREAKTFAEALASAVRDIHRVRGIRVVRIEPDDLVTASEIAERLGRTRESVRLLASGRRGGGTFPPPASHLRARGRLWRWADVLAWAGASDDDREAAQLVAAINAALELQTREASLTGPVRDVLKQVTTIHATTKTAKSGSRHAIGAGSKARAASTAKTAVAGRSSARAPARKARKSAR